MHSSIACAQFKRKALKDLHQLHAKLQPVSYSSLTQEALKALSIQCSMMSLRPDRSDSSPKYCTLASSSATDEALDDAFPVDKGLGFPEYDLEFDDRYYNAYRFGDVLDYIIYKLHDQEPLGITLWYGTGDSTKELTKHRGFYHGDYEREQWGSHEIYRADSIHHPHLACLLVDGAPADEGLRPSEILVAVRLMKQSLRIDTKHQFRVNPVFVYSIAARKARILEVYYEGGKLIVHKTSYLNFEEVDREDVKLYLRWMMSVPKGHTTFAAGDDWSGIKYEVEYSGIG